MTPAHLQIAAQVPSQWYRSVDTIASTVIALRKIVYRALISPNVRGVGNDGTKYSSGKGKLSNRAFFDFSTFLKKWSEEKGLDLTALENVALPIRVDLSRRIEVLHTLRSILGPLIESLIIIDRILWLRENLGPGADVRIVNLFDQAMDSGRNIAIVITPLIE